ncbi:MAG: hypothetical protein KF788_20310 [Piscinibacter sp.]|nr:hypothetical protein [Piscinibacter sp.]
MLDGGGRQLVLPIGPQQLAERFRDPPTPTDIEHAIDLIEDAIGGLDRGPLAGQADLETAEPLLFTLPGFEAPAAVLTREAVEALFQRLASRAFGARVASTDLPPGRELAAVLVILRECMHHLGFDRVRRVPAIDVTPVPDGRS